MTRIVRLSVLALALSTAAFAGPGRDHQPDPDKMTARLTENLGLDDKTAGNVVDALLAGHEEGQALKDAMRTEAEGLKAALDAGDDKAMVAHMNELRAVKDDLRALHEATQAAVRDQLTVEQEAQWMLHHLHKAHMKEQAFREMRRDRR